MLEEFNSEHWYAYSIWPELWSLIPFPHLKMVMIYILIDSHDDEVLKFLAFEKMSENSNLWVRKYIARIIPGKFTDHLVYGIEVAGYIKILCEHL